MSRSAVEIVLCVISIAALATSIPVAGDNDSKKNADEPAPLWQIDDDKIKVNFGGYHAEAGLGTRRNGGGLHASAGTPNARASAGLGGSVNNDGATGGLHAGASINSNDNAKDETNMGQGMKDGQNTNIQTIPRQPGPGFRKHRPFGQNAGNTRLFAKIDSGSEAQTPRQYGQPGGKGTLFDDIFNIPIAALNAVNQLLKNHVG